MFRFHAFVILSAASLSMGCASREPSFVPLGRGPLSLAELDAGTSTARANTPKRLLDRLPAQDKPEEEPVIALATREAPSSREAAPRAGDSTVEAEPSKDAGLVSGSATDAWLGLYRGSDITTFKAASQPDRQFDDPKARIRVERGAPDRLAFALVDSTNDKDICILSATVDGDKATIDPGQSCFLDPEESMTVRSRPGKAMRRNQRLTLDIIFETKLDTEMGTVDGSIEYHFDGQR